MKEILERNNTTRTLYEVLCDIQWGQPASGSLNIAPHTEESKQFRCM